MIKLQQLPCEQILQVYKIYRTFFCAKQVGEKLKKIQNSRNYNREILYTDFGFFLDLNNFGKFSKN